MSTENTTNGTATPAKEASLVKQLNAAWVKAGKNKPSKKEGQELKAAYLSAHKARKAAEAALTAAKQVETKAVIAIVTKCGSGPVEIDGVRYIPMSRTDAEGQVTAYLRGEGYGEATSL